MGITVIDTTIDTNCNKMRSLERFIRRMSDLEDAGWWGAGSFRKDSRRLKQLAESGNLTEAEFEKKVEEHKAVAEYINKPSTEVVDIADECMLFRQIFGSESSLSFLLLFPIGCIDCILVQSYS